jgi:hypothetical protein
MTSHRYDVTLTCVGDIGDGAGMIPPVVHSMCGPL